MLSLTALDGSPFDSVIQHTREDEAGGYCLSVDHDRSQPRGRSARRVMGEAAAPDPPAYAAAVAALQRLGCGEHRIRAIVDEILRVEFRPVGLSQRATARSRLFAQRGFASEEEAHRSWTSRINALHRYTDVGTMTVRRIRFEFGSVVTASLLH